MPRVIKREAAKRDLTQHFVYLAEHASLAVARRFLGAAQSTFVEISRMPEIGTPGKVGKGKLAGIRLWPVHGFDRYLIAYKPLKDAILIERVFHSSQDYARVLK